MGRTIAIIVFTLLGAGGGFLIGQWYHEARSPDPETLQTDLVIDSVTAEGKIKPAGGIHPVTALPGRQVETVLVKVGSQVVADQTQLCRMVDEPLLKMQWELAAARQEDLDTEIEQRILAARLNRSSAEAALKKARFNQMRLSDESTEASYADRKIETSTRKLNRLKELAESDDTAAFVSIQDILDQELELEKAVAERQSLRQAADLAVETAAQALEIAEESLANAQAAKKESRALVLAEAIAKQQYENSLVMAPIDGEVVQIHVTEGQNVANLPIMEVADLSSMIVEAEVYFANLNDVRPGQAVEISSPALSRAMTGKVVSKSNYIGSGILQSANPLAMTNQETAQVVIAIDSEFTEMARSFLNLQVTVKIDTKNIDTE